MAENTNWHTLRGERPVDPERDVLDRRVAEASVRLGTLDLGALRRRRGVSQAVVADGLGVSQPNISRIEQQGDIRLSTLSHYVAALGGRLEVRAVFDRESTELLTDPGKG